MTTESWLGEFFSNSSHDEAIPGLISYSHSQGVILRFLKRISSQWIQPSVLHGILETGEECTLFGPVRLPNVAPEQYYKHYRGSTVVSGEVGYKYLAIGKHLGINDTVGEASFTFAGIGRFATGLDTFLQAQEAPLSYCGQTTIGKISVWRQDNGVCLLNIKEAVFSSNSAALENLSLAHDAIAKEHGAHFLMRKSSEYRIIIEFNSEVPLHDGYLAIQKLIDLVSLLLYSPVIAEAVDVSKGSLGDRRLIIYTSLTPDRRTLDIINSRRAFRESPIGLTNVQFSDVVKIWHAESEKYATLVSGIQSRTGIKAIHEVYAEIILYCAFMESIAHEEGFAAKQKYEGCLRDFACSDLQKKILAVFELDSISKAGTAIADVRAEIVHFRGTRRWIDQMPASVICQLSQYLELIVIGCLLRRLGIGHELIGRYQMLHSEIIWTGI